MDFSWGTQVVALTLTFVGGLATVLGGSLALLAGTPNPRKLGAMLGGSSGVMLYIAFADLIPDSALAIGYPYTWLFFVLGVVGFSLVMYYIPEPHFDGDDDDEGHGHSHGHGSREERSGCENAEARHGPTKAGLATAIGMCIHNLPEGIAVYISCLRGLDVGLSLAVAIIIHVIPEGMAIAAPIYHSTGSKWEAIKWALLAGMCQPVGALVFGIAFSHHLTPFVLSAALSAVAGIMALLCVQELIPTCLRHLSLWEAGMSHMFGALTIYFTVTFVQRVLGVEK